MGTCVRMIVEYQDAAGEWRPAGIRFEAKNYTLAKHLAGVRLDEGDTVTPIALPRGAPEGYEVDELGDLRVGPTWLGWHDHSWLLLSEVLVVDWSGIDPDFVVLLDYAEGLGAPEKTRLVFGFDS